MILDFLASNGPLVKEVIGDAVFIIATASAIAAVTPTPDPDTMVGKVYHWAIEVPALLLSRAKEEGVAIPAPTPEFAAVVDHIARIARAAETIASPAAATVVTETKSVAVATPAAPVPA
jgi:hypothetical protein